MKVKTKRLLKRIIATLIGASIFTAMVAGVWIGAVFFASKAEHKKLEAWQVEHLEEIREKVAQGYQPKDQQQFCDFDLQQAYDDGVKFNEIQFLGTHNSYKAKSTALMYASEPFAHKRFDYYFDPLFDQLDNGIFSLELDGYATSTRFLCLHKTYGDCATHCYDMSLALEEINIWSDANPGHLPITIMFQAKGWVIHNKDTLEFTEKETSNRFDNLLKEVFGDKIYTPNDFLDGNYESLQEAALANAWPTLADMRGKIVFMYLMEKDFEYVKFDKSMQTQQMFPLVKMNLPEKHLEFEAYRAFALVDETFKDDKAKIAKMEKKGKATYEISEYFQKAREDNIYIRTRIDMYEHYSEEAVPIVLAAGGNVLSTDFPPHLNDRVDYVISLEKTVFIRE